MYKVISGENEYFVNTDVELCTCYKGNNGAPCKHQYGVVKTFKLTSQQFVPVTDVKMKSILHKLVNNKAAPNSWYESLRSTHSVPQNNIDLPNVKNNENQINYLVMESSISTEIEQSANNNNNQICLQENIEAESIQLLKNVESLNSKLINNPNVFYPAIKKFNKLFCEIKTDSSMVSALHTFGKYSGAGQPIIRKRKNLQGGKSIGVQPTALSRRRAHLGGRNVAYTGRPPKNKNDHTYYKKKRLTPSELPISLRQKAPHSLSFCIDNNISLGKTH